MHKDRSKIAYILPSKLPRITFQSLKLAVVYKDILKRCTACPDSRDYSGDLSMCLGDVRLKANQKLLLGLCSESTEVNKVSFTGSVATGRRIGLCAMQNLKPATLELGGKSPVIVFADAVKSEEDLEKTVEWIMVRPFFRFCLDLPNVPGALYEMFIACRSFLLFSELAISDKKGNWSFNCAV